MPNPVPYVIIHHSYIPPACHTTSECIGAMQSMQDFHIYERGWNDIGYSFAVGGDGNAYTGRGWSSVGAHAPLYNSQSIGICVIGDWREDLPPENQLETVHNLIQLGVDSGYIRSDYILHGHRQVRANTECPGDRLFEEIQTWPHFSSDFGKSPGQLQDRQQAKSTPMELGSLMTRTQKPTTSNQFRMNSKPNWSSGQLYHQTDEINASNKKSNRSIILRNGLKKHSKNLRKTTTNMKMIILLHQPHGAIRDNRRETNLMHY
ncbi:N-acetylmuramoyl-L-alanine amidase [Popillia japonica]|uniref:N-acetylmuramoyl-L-alanine amidase n=1 Tax=Popillia japonica TaxID=7064 RepID=A0AAW1J082_POPJA